MKIEDSHFWPAERTKLWLGVLAVIFIAAILMFAICGWVLYQQKIEDSNANSNPQSGQASVSFNANTGSNGVAPSSLSPATN